MTCCDGYRQLKLGEMNLAISADYPEVFINEQP